MKKLRFIILTFILLLLLFFTAGYISSLSPEVTTHTIHSTLHSGQTGSIRVVQLSDLHSACYGPQNQDLLKLIAGQNPDLIFCTGDMIGKNSESLDGCVFFCSRLTEIAPVYYSVGNYEADCEEYRQLYHALLKAGVHVLDESADEVNIRGLSICIGGAYRDSSVISLADKEAVDILLSHIPDSIILYAELGYPLVFSGHAHGGQIRIPFLNIGLLDHNCHFFPQFDGGLYQLGGTQMFVSRGLGNSTFPIRLYNAPEVALVNIIFE